MRRIMFILGLTVTICAVAGEGKQPLQPMFYCGFESSEEIDKLGGKVSSEAKFIDGKKGKALDLADKFACDFPSNKSIPGTEGTLCAWIRPNWNLKDIKNPRVRLFAVINSEQNEKPVHLFNYFCILGYSYGDLSKGIPYKLYCLVRKTKGEQGLLLIPDATWKANTWQHVAVSWRIGTGRKNGEFKFYLNGKMLARRTEFRAVKIKLGKRLSCAPRGAIDELKIWNRILSAAEINAEYSENK